MKNNTAGDEVIRERLLAGRLNKYSFERKLIKKFNPGRHVVARLILKN
jgi:hypothetical protein